MATTPRLDLNSLLLPDVTSPTIAVFIALSVSAVAVVARFRAAAGVTHLSDRPTIEAAVTDPTGMSGLEATVNSVAGFPLLGDHRCPADGAWQGYR